MLEGYFLKDRFLSRYPPSKRQDNVLVEGGGEHRAQSARCSPPHTPWMKTCLFDRREKSIY